MILDSISNRPNMSRQSIPSVGLTAVVNPAKPSLDLVFVHGFTGHPVRTWTHNKGDVSQQSHDENEFSEPPAKKPKLNLFSKSRVCSFTIFVLFLKFARFTPGPNRAYDDIKIYGVLIDVANVQSLSGINVNSSSLFNSRKVVTQVFTGQRIWSRPPSPVLAY